MDCYPIFDNYLEIMELMELMELIKLMVIMDLFMGFYHIFYQVNLIIK